MWHILVKKLQPIRRCISETVRNRTKVISTDQQ